MSRPDIAWGFGATAETYGVKVWISRIENLKSHFSIIADYLPEDAEWLHNQVRYAMSEADRYLADAVPADSSDDDCECGTCNVCTNRAEAAHERMIEDFHDGGSGFRTMAERHREAWDQKQELRR